MYTHNICVYNLVDADLKDLIFDVIRTHKQLNILQPNKIATNMPIILTNYYTGVSHEKKTTGKQKVKVLSEENVDWSTYTMDFANTSQYTYVRQ